MRTLRYYNQALISVISPTVVFGTIWITQAFAYLILPINLVPPTQAAWLVVVTGFLSLFAGAFAFGITNRHIMQSIDSSLIKTVKPVQVSRQLIYASIALSASVVLYLIATIEKNEIGFIHSLKENLLAETVADSKGITYLIYFFIYQVLLTLYYFNCNGFKKDGRTVLIFLAAVTSAVMSGSRGLLVFFLIALIPCIAGKRHEFNFNVKALCQLSIFVVVSFFVYPFVFQGMSTGDGFDWSVLVNYISIYLFSGIAAFSDYLKTNVPTYDCLLAAPRPLLGLLNTLSGMNLTVSCPPYYDEKLLPLPTNVYSIFYAPYHDLGLVGVIIYLFAIGFISQMGFARGYLHNNGSWRFFYCILFYSLVFSFFEDQFSRGAIYYFFGAIAVFSNRIIRGLSK